MCYRDTTTEAFRNCICTIGYKKHDIATCLQTLYGYNDNQYWTILINSATRECSTDPVPQAHLIWSNKNTTPVMELQNFL